MEKAGASPKTLKALIESPCKKCMGNAELMSFGGKITGFIQIPDN